MGGIEDPPSVDDGRTYYRRSRGVSYVLGILVRMTAMEF